MKDTKYQKVKIGAFYQEYTIESRKEEIIDTIFTILGATALLGLPLIITIWLLLEASK